jgi:DnaJ-class molecular chaperone
MKEYKTVKETCPYCNGVGYRFTVLIMSMSPRPCYYCGGSGHVEKKIKVTI